MCRNIREVYVAFISNTTPAKPGVDSLGKLSAVRFVDATRIYPKVLQAIASGLFSAEAESLIASLTLASTIHQVFEGDLVSVRSPRVREYCIGRNLIDKTFIEAEFALVFEF